MRVQDAVRISMSIPFYFEAVFLDSSGRIVHHPRNKQGLDIMTDGGFIANFPIRIFDSTRYFDSARSNQFATNWNTLGFRIDRAAQVSRDSSDRSLAPFEINSIGDYLGAFYNIVIENLNRQPLNNSDWMRTVSIPDGDVGARIRKLSKEELNILTGNGSAALKNFLERREFIE